MHFRVNLSHQLLVRQERWLCGISAKADVISYPARWSFSFILGPLHQSFALIIFPTSREHRNCSLFSLFSPLPHLSPQTHRPNRPCCSHWGVNCDIIGYENLASMTSTWWGQSCSWARASSWRGSQLVCWDGDSSCPCGEPTHFTSTSTWTFASIEVD